MNTNNIDQAQIEQLLRRWASALRQWTSATRNNQHDMVLVNHAADVLIYDVLAPMKYEGADAYRRSWDDWQPMRRVIYSLSLKICLSRPAAALHLHTV